MHVSGPPAQPSVDRSAAVTDPEWSRERTPRDIGAIQVERGLWRGLLVAGGLGAMVWLLVWLAYRWLW